MHACTICACLEIELKIKQLPFGLAETVRPRPEAGLLLRCLNNRRCCGRVHKQRHVA